MSDETNLPFAAALTCLSTISIAAGKPINYPAKTWQAVQTFDIVKLSKNLDEHTRQLVGVKFNFRGKDIRHLKPNWYQSSIWQPVPGESGKFAHIAVMVAKGDVEAFKTFSSDSSGAEMTVYGRVEYEIATNYRFIRLVGRKVTTDAAGNATVTW